MKNRNSQLSILRAKECLLSASRRSTSRAFTAPQHDIAKTILIVDDNYEMLGLIRQLLACDGYTLLDADSGESALKVWKKHSPTIALVIADVVLPGMTGLELVDLLREERPDLEVIVMSGFLPEILRTCIKPLNATSFLEKPFSAQNLRKTVQLRLSCSST